ncbi:unnamed protein product [Hymenolepis diminuta]|uniref:Uncharacterized protein n=1 Tax=Hymenolepis diminuta TaxID=6216 RepID=A0A564Y8G3_HYMDI|nr:unnamed protein product [Hymenolepis diminuta]
MQNINNGLNYPGDLKFISAQDGSEFSEPYTPTSDDYSIDTDELEDILDNIYFENGLFDLTLSSTDPDNESTDGDVGVGNVDDVYFDRLASILVRDLSLIEGSTRIFGVFLTENEEE